MGGYLPAGMTDDDFERALAAVGRGNDYGDALPTRAPSSAAPVSDQPQESRLPPENPYPEEAPIRVQRERGAPLRNARSYQAQSDEVTNQRIEGMGDMGDKAGVDAQGHEERAKLYQAHSERARGYNDEAETATREHEAERARWKAESERLYNDMKANAHPPAESTFAKVMAVVGGALGHSGGKGAAIASGLGAMVGERQNEWRSEQAMRGQLYQVAMANAHDEDSATLAKLDTAQKLSALRLHEVDAAAASAEELAQSRTTKSAIQDGRLKLKQDWLDSNMAAEEHKAQLMQKSRANAANAAQRDAISRMPTDQLLALREQGGLSEVGQKILDERIGTSQKQELNDASVAEKRATAAKNQREAGAAGSEQEVLPGLIATIPLEKKDVSDIRTNAQVLKKIEGNYQQLADIRKRNKGNVNSWVDKDDARTAKNIISEMTGVMNQFAGRGAPSNVELEDMKEQLLDPTSSYWLTDPEQVYKNQVTRLKTNFAAGLESIGIQPKPGAEPSARGGPVAGPKKYRFTPDAPAVPSVRSPQYAGAEMGD